MEQTVQSLQLKNLEGSQSSQLTLEKAKKLFFLSFRFSQGNNTLQDKIFKYLHLLNPAWCMSYRFRDQLRDEVSEPIKKFIGFPVIPSESTDATLTSHAGAVFGVREIIMKELRDMQENLNLKDKDTKDSNALLGQITGLIIEKDYEYLCKKDGRPRVPVTETTRHMPVSDPLLSHICWYALEGNPTGAAEYDQMFKDVGKTTLDILQGTLVVPEIMEPIIKPNTKDSLVAVVDKYAETHPQSVAKLKSLGFPLGHIA